jgi:hypothetical protein
MSGGAQTIKIKTNNVSCHEKNSACGLKTPETMATARSRAYSLDVPTTRYFNNSSGASSNDGSRKSLSSNRNDDAEDSTDNNSVFASKKMSGEVEANDIWQSKFDAVGATAKIDDGHDETDTHWTSFTHHIRRFVCKCCEKDRQQVPTANV